MKRILALILSACMMTTVAPTAVLAADMSTEVAAVEEEGSEDSTNETVGGTEMSAGAYVLSQDEAWEDENYTGTVRIPQGVELTTAGTTVINGDVYVFGTLTNTGNLTVNGTLYCLKAYGGMFSAGNYDYGIFNNSGSLKVTELHVRDDYLNTQVSGDSDTNTNGDQTDTGTSDGGGSDITILDKNVTLSKTSYPYDGKAKEPKVTVKSDDGTVLKEGTDYKVSYQDNVEPGTAKVIINGAGNYYAEITKEFTIYNTGWQKTSSGWVYIKTNGNHAASEWITDNGKRYYFSSNGIMATGWQKVNGSWYYLNTNGAMATGWKQIGGSWYYLNSNGVMATGWQKVNGSWYYLNTNGTMATGWKQIGGNWYYLNTNGTMATGWKQISGNWYYLNTNGTMATGWKRISGNWYYLNTNGTMATGWKQIGGNWYYLNTNGTMATGWQKISGSWYYLSTNGAMATGWKKIGNAWYYFSSSGAMTANRWVENYYVEGSGAMATNKWIGNYHVGSDGKWDQTRSSGGGSTGTKPSTTQSSTVYWTDGGKVYHKTPNCVSLRRSTNIHSGTIAQSGKSRACRNCY